MINSELESELIHKFVSIPSPEKEERLLVSEESKSEEILENIEISHIESRLSYLNEMIDNILYGGNSKQSNNMNFNSQESKKENSEDEENLDPEIELKIKPEIPRFFDNEHKSQLHTATFHQKEESCGLKCEENLEGSNAAIKNCISFERKIAEEPHQFTFCKNAPEVSMQTIEPVCFVTPQKKVLLEEVIAPSSKEGQSDSLCLKDQSGCTLKSETSFSNGTPKFKQLAKRLIDFKDSEVSKANNECSNESILNKSDDYESRRITLKKSSDSFLTSKDFLKKNNIELVGVFYSGIFNKETQDKQTKKRDIKEAMKKLDDKVTEIFTTPNENSIL